jgi:hypothetical protein
METVFSHIIQKRFSQVNEDIATDALAFILNSSESARNGMMKLLRGIDPKMPNLQFRSQQTEGNIRPDIWGYEETEPHVFVENKFWAGLTENQPISYLRQLAEYTQPTILLVVVPVAREQTMWRELNRRLEDVGISAIYRDIDAGGIVCSITTEIGPILAITSWTRLLSTLDLEVADDQSARSDLLQLRALCESADSDAFLPISSAEVTDQRTPAFILQLGSIVQASVDMAVTKEILNIKGLMPQSTWERIGRYARFSDEGAGFWFGIHFSLWKKHGGTPLWLLFSASDFGRLHEVQPILEPWTAREGVFTTMQNGELAVAVDIAFGEDKDQVVRSVVDHLKGIADILHALNPKPVSLDNA